MQNSDYTAKDLAEIFGISIFTARIIKTGRYKIGGRVRFRKEDIDFARQTGKKIEML